VCVCVCVGRCGCPILERVSHVSGLGYPGMHYRCGRRVAL